MSQYINILPIHSLETSKSQNKKRRGSINICGICPGALSEAQLCIDMPIASIQGCVPAFDTG